MKAMDVNQILRKRGTWLINIVDLSDFDYFYDEKNYDLVKYYNEGLDILKAIKLLLNADDELKKGYLTNIEAIEWADFIQITIDTKMLNDIKVWEINIKYPIQFKNDNIELVLNNLINYLDNYIDKFIVKMIRQKYLMGRLKL